jgi:1,4-alpha-glucan branching enzyme
MARRNTNGKQQTFSITAPGAMNVALAGDFTNWQQKPIPLQPQGGGLWKVTVELPPGTHHYRFIVDGQWRDDPDCPIRVANPYGTQNAVRRVA